MDGPFSSGEDDCDESDTSYYYLSEKYNLGISNHETIVFKRLSINLDTLEDTVFLKRDNIYDSLARDENLCKFCDCFYESKRIEYRSDNGMAYNVSLSANKFHPKFKVSFEDVIGPRYGVITVKGGDEQNMTSFKADRGDSTYLKFDPDSGLMYYFNRGIQTYALTRIN